MPEKKTQISIRLDNSVAEELSERANREGLSRNALAARLISDALGHEEPSPLATVAESLARTEDLLRHLVSKEESDTVHRAARVVPEAVTELADNLPRLLHEMTWHQTLHEEQLKKQRKDLAKAVAVLLVNGGKVSPSKAKAWVNEHLLKHATVQPAVRQR